MSTSNMPVITLGEFIEIIKLQMSEGNTRPLMGLGLGGIGKSESMAGLAKELNIGYIDIRLLLYTETDLKGIPYPDENHKYTIWLQNKILPAIERDGDRGILVLDEITSCPRSVRTAAYQLLNERKLGEYTLPDGWIVVCLGNGSSDGGDFRGMEANFANRCSVYRIQIDLDSWKSWAMKNGVNKLVVGYLNFNKSDLHTFNAEVDDNIVFSSPRSWTAVSDILNACTDTKQMTSKMTQVRIAGAVGSAVASRFRAFCSYENAVDITDILDKGIKVVPKNTEIANIAIQSVVKQVIDDLSRDIANHATNYSADTLTHLANALNWIGTLKAEWGIMAIKDLKSWNIKIISPLLLNRDLQAMAPDFKLFLQKNSCIFD